MSTPPTSTPWVPILDIRPKIVVPTPVNGKWVKEAGGALVWDDPRATVADTAWNIITSFTNGWTAWSDVNYGPPRYRRLIDGFVVLEGLIGGAGTASTTAFTLPVGYRPKDQEIGSTAIRHFYGAASYGNPPWGTFWVYSDGQVRPQHAGASTWISLNNIRFYAGG